MNIKSKIVHLIKFHIYYCMVLIPLDYCYYRNGFNGGYHSSSIHGSHCMLDPKLKYRPVVGYINLCAVSYIYVI